MVFGRALDKLQRKGIEKIVRARAVRYAKQSGVVVNPNGITIDYFDDDYRIRIHYTAKSQDQLARFQKLLQQDKYLKGHL